MYLDIRAIEPNDFPTQENWENLLNNLIGSYPWLRGAVRNDDGTFAGETEWVLEWADDDGSYIVDTFLYRQDAEIAATEGNRLNDQMGSYRIREVPLHIQNR